MRRLKVLSRFLRPKKRGAAHDRCAVRSAVGGAEGTQVDELLSEIKHCAARVQDHGYLESEVRATVSEENEEPVIWGGEQDDAADL